MTRLVPVRRFPFGLVHAAASIQQCFRPSGIRPGAAGVCGRRG